MNGANLAESGHPERSPGSGDRLRLAHQTSVSAILIPLSVSRVRTFGIETSEADRRGGNIGPLGSESRNPAAKLGYADCGSTHGSPGSEAVRTRLKRQSSDFWEGGGAGIRIEHHAVSVTTEEGAGKGGDGPASDFWERRGPKTRGRTIEPVGGSTSVSEGREQPSAPLPKSPSAAPGSGPSSRTFGIDLSELSAPGRHITGW
jgi:hypothetical protein